MDKPQVSVLMIFYDRGIPAQQKYFAQALNSILGQTFRSFEVVLVVSGEKEFARRLASKSPKVRFFYYKIKGMDYGRRTLAQRVYELNSARNLCLRHARGKYVCFMDSDDVSTPDRLGRQLAFLRSHPDIGVVGSSMLLISEEGKEFGKRRAPENDSQIRRSMLQFNPIPQPTVMAYASLIRKAGGYSTKEIAEDFELWVQLAKITKFHNLASPVLFYRVHRKAASSEYKLQLYFSSLRTKIRAAKSLGMMPGPKDVAVNALQFASLFFPDSIRRTVLEKMRSRFVVGS